MDIQAPVRPTQQTAKELVREVLLGSQPGNILPSRRPLQRCPSAGRDLLETDCQLVEMIVDSASVWGLFIA
ncbi:hypothetical protein, partial [Mesorhizobium sp. LSHC440A00]|uniref:hypothetical protein n=1 Tax=Mesorhizobium sp. LSHC440A00 TaxID=1287307 RepID=UPI0003CEBA3D